MNNNYIINDDSAIIPTYNTEYDPDNVYSELFEFDSVVDYKELRAKYKNCIDCWNNEFVERFFYYNKKMNLELYEFFQNRFNNN